MSTIKNNHGQDINEDARVYLTEQHRKQYGGARMIDALTFVQHHPDIRLQEGFIIGLYHYNNGI